jgi:hypothetical protein
MKKLKLCADVMALGGSFIGAALIASNTDISKYGFLAFLIGGIGSTYLFHVSNVSKSVKIINYYYLIINSVGIIRWFL